MSAIEELNKLRIKLNSFLEEEILEPDEKLNKALDEALLALEEKENDKLLGAVEYSKRIKHRLREMELQGKTIIIIAELIEVINTLEKEALGVLQNGK